MVNQKWLGGDERFAAPQRLVGMVLTYARQPHGRGIVKIVRALLCSALFLSVCVACGTPRSAWEFQREVIAAEALADQGEYEEALQEYTRLSALADTQLDLQHLQFRSAYMWEQMGNADEALAAYARIYSRPTHPYDDNAGRAMYRAGRVYRDILGDEDTAIEVWIATVRAFPETSFATDALNGVERYYKQQERYEELMDLYADLFVELRDRDIAHALVYKTGVILQDELDRCYEAQELYVLMIDQFQRSSLVDDAIWRRALCYRHHDQIDEEYRILDDFVSGREMSILLGDYDYVHYNPALKRLAEIHEDRGDIPGAIRAYRRFQKTFPLSLDNDDLQFKIIQLYGELGDIQAMRRYAKELEKFWPESRYVSRVEAVIQEAESGR